MNNKPIIPNNRKAQKRDSKNIDADKIQNLTLGELQESLINSTLRIKGKDDFSPNYGLAKASCYSLFGGIGNPDSPKEIVDAKKDINNWLDYQNEINKNEPYNYLTFGAFKQWARSIINLLGKSGDSLTTDLYFCDVNGEKIDSVKIGPLYNNDKYYFKFCQKNFDQVVSVSQRLFIPTIDDLKGQDYVITLENSQENIYSITINVLQYKPRSTSIDFKLLYQEASYEASATLTVEIPEWSLLLVSEPLNKNSQLSNVYISSDDTSLISIDDSSGTKEYYFLLLHYCYYYESLVNKGDWVIEPQKLISECNLDYKTGVTIQNRENYPILNERESFIVYELTVKYDNLYHNLDSEQDSLIQILNIQAGNLCEFNVAFSIKENTLQFAIVDCEGAKKWNTNGGATDFTVGSGGGSILVGKQQDIYISSAIEQLISLKVKINYVQSDSLDDQFVNCYGTSKDISNYLKIGSDELSNSFVSEDIDEGSPTIYTLENLRVVRVNTTSNTVDVPIYFARLTSDEDKEFRETFDSDDIEDWIIKRKKKTEFPIFKVIIKIQKTEWNAYLTYPITSNSTIQSTQNVNGADYLFQLIPVSNIDTSKKEYKVQFKLETSNVSQAEGSIYQATAESISFTNENTSNDSPFQKITLTKQDEGVQNQKNFYKFEATLKLNPENFFKSSENYQEYQDVLFLFSHDTGQPNKIIIRFVPRDIIIYKISDETYKLIEISDSPQEIISFTDPLTKSHQEEETQFSNFSFTYDVSFPRQPIGCNDGFYSNKERFGLYFPKYINDNAFKHENEYFYGLVELGIHLNKTENSPSVRLYISSRFDDWIEGIWINRLSGSLPSPDFSYSNKEYGFWVWGLSISKNFEWGELEQFGPIDSSKLVNGKNTIEFFVSNPPGMDHGFFQFALTTKEPITVSNYKNSPWNYKNDLTK